MPERRLVFNYVKNLSSSIKSGAGEFNVVVDDEDKTKLGKVSELSEVVLTQLLHKDSLIRMDVKE